MTATQIRGIAGGPTPAARARHESLDKLRGLAVVLMVLDHVLALTDVSHANALRWTVTRLALPLFFLLAGHLVRRLSWRHAWCWLLGVTLTGWVPWIDNPNVLEWYAVGAVVLVLGRKLTCHWPLALALLALTMSANGLAYAGESYNPFALWGLMGLGAVVHREQLQTLGRRLPRHLVYAGRWPLSVYVGHVLLLQLLVVIWP